MPVLIDAVPKYLDKLFQDRRVAAVAFLGEFGGVMVVAVDAAVVLVVAVLCAEDSRAYAASEVFDMIFAIERGNV